MDKIKNLGVFLIIEDASGEFLITRNNRSPSLFELPGGGMNNGESEIDAALREAEEETSLKIENENLLKVAVLKSRKGGPDSALYYTKILESKPSIILCPKECSGYFWEKDLNFLLEREKILREAGFPESITRGHFCMLTIFNYWKSLSEKKVIEGHLSSKSNSLSLNDFLED